MPRPIFDIEQYELRGIKPEVFTQDQKQGLNKALARVHGQVDWTAQLLGFNGPNYWGKANPKQDYSYNFVGLPDTMNEKRQMQTGAFGVYNKDKDYSEWPAPFNRSQILASGDFTFHIWVDELAEKTHVAAFGQGEDLTYEDDPIVFVGGQYIFDAECEFEILHGGDQDDISPSIIVESFYDEGVWTRLRVEKFIEGSLRVAVKGKEAEPFTLEVINWEDISDWNIDRVYKQFIGCWGNKGSSLSFDTQFDSLSIHGCDEHYSIYLDPTLVTVGIDEVLAKVGLERSPWTHLHPEKFAFTAVGCDLLVPYQPIRRPIGNPWFADKYWDPSYIPSRVEVGECQPDCNSWMKIWQLLEDDLYDDGEYVTICSDDPAHIEYDNDLFVNNPQDDTLLVDWEYHNEEYPVERRTELYYNRRWDPPEPSECDEAPYSTAKPGLNNGEYDVGEIRSSYDEADEGIYDRHPWSGITGFQFIYEALTAKAILEPPCLTWSMDPTLDNGTLEESIHNVFTRRDPNDDFWTWTDGPWATANDGEYDSTDPCLSVSMGEASCAMDDSFCGFDDGEFDSDKFIEKGIWDSALASHKDPVALYCEDEPEDCYADGGVYHAVSGPPNYEEDCLCVVECCLIDNDYIPPPPPYTGPNLSDGGEYGAYDPAPNPLPEMVACPVDEVYVVMDELYSARHQMIPSIRNATTPLRLWKNNTLMQTDELPAFGTEDYRNFLVADKNRSAEAEDSFRHFVRLPLEYQRNGTEWSRSLQIAKNQSYYSTPTKLTKCDYVDEEPRPTLFSQKYADLDDQPNTIIYDEGYLYSESLDDKSSPTSGPYESAAVVLEEERSSQYNFGSVTDYDPWDLRKPKVNGDWQGEYYHLGPYGIETTGHTTADIASGRLIPADQTEYPVYDISEVKYPNVTFPDEKPEASIKDYTVSYAYFACDFSASDDPVFEPTTAYCWRNPQYDADVLKNGECVYKPGTTNTAYLLHTKEINYGKRTRPARVAGETSAKTLAEEDARVSRAGEPFDYDEFDRSRKLASRAGS